MNDFQTWITVLGGAGFLGAVVTLIKGLVGWRTGRSGRKMRAAHDAIDSLNLAARWAEAYWHGRDWCHRWHKPWTDEFENGYPPPPDDDHTPD